MLCSTLGRVAVAIEHVGSAAILRIHAKAYDELKLDLASMYSDNRKAYIASKDLFTKDTIREAINK